MPSFPEFENDLEFLKQLILEQGIVALPGYVSKRDVSHNLNKKKSL